MAIVKWEQPGRRGNLGKQMSINEISINYVAKGNNALTFNQFLNNEIEKRELSRLSIQQEDTTGEIYLVLNREEGIPLTQTGGNTVLASGKKSYNYRVCSKVWVERLIKELGIQTNDTRHVLRITDNLAKKDDCMTFRILGKQ